MTVPSVGIDRLGIYTSHYAIDLATVAAARGVDPARLCRSLGQQQMAVSPPDEDPVTLGANAARPLLGDIDPDSIRLLIFGTETGIDQAKSAGLYVHRLLGLSSRCRVFELKQACYGAAAGLQVARQLVAADPGTRALVVGADIARYGLGTPGEFTQGGGAAAMLVSADPRLLAIEDAAGYYAADVMDFWRPNYRDEALVDGKASVRIYIRALLASWDHFREQAPGGIDSFARFCYHMPFPRMAEIAHQRLRAQLGAPATPAAVRADLGPSQDYVRRIGNCYVASLFIGLAALLERTPDDLTGQRLGLFSYGSGCMGEFFAGRVQPGYRAVLAAAGHARLLDRRNMLDCATYESLYRQPRQPAPETASLDFPAHRTGAYRLAAIRDHQRVYEETIL